MINIKEIGSREQLFHHIDDKGKRYSIAVDRLTKKLEQKGKIEQVEINAELFTIFVNKSGIEKHRLDRAVDFLKKNHQKAGFKIRPITVCWMKDETWLLADGNHRYCAAFLVGLPTIPAYIAQRQDWAPYIIKGISEVDFKAFSGIL